MSRELIPMLALMAFKDGRMRRPFVTSAYEAPAMFTGSSKQGNASCDVRRKRPRTRNAT